MDSTRLRFRGGGGTLLSEFNAKAQGDLTMEGMKGMERNLKHELNIERELLNC